MSVNYRLDVQHEFNFVPGTDKPVGYLAKATLFGKSLPADIKVTAPLVPATSTTLPGPGPVTAVGVIQNLSWDGGDDSAFNFSFYFSQANATLIRSLQQQLVETNAITQLDWWVAAFDAETKALPSPQVLGFYRLSPACQAEPGILPSLTCRSSLITVRAQ
jgi:hypothetical protein